MRAGENEIDAPAPAARPNQPFFPFGCDCVSAVAGSHLAGIGLGQPYSGWPYHDDEAEIPLLASPEDYLAIGD